MIHQTILKQAVADGKLLQSSLDNLEAWIQGDFMPSWALQSIETLIENGDWAELNDRFYKTIAFGTGGMRDRTIGGIITPAEKGNADVNGMPEFAAVGTAMMNDFNVIRATIGLYRYCARFLEKELGRPEQPRLVIAHDVRHFSRHFCELAASTFTRLGGSAMIFSGPRSTPQLSFSVRYLNATAGVVITASHNPPQYNGFKAYFRDGAQVVSPDAEGIIHEVYSVKAETIVDHLKIDLSKVITLPERADADYVDSLSENILNPSVFKSGTLKVVFTPIHGTGSVASLPALKACGINVFTVPEQEVMDGRFPTVKSPNPEEAPALDMALERAKAIDADILLATDPDADRMGAAIKAADGKWSLITGNMIGSLLAEYRISTMKQMGWLPAAGSPNATLIKTFVTTPLQEAIAKGHGLKCVDTLTGFKWIGEKLRHYELELKQKLLEQEGIALDYDGTSAAKRRELLLKYSTFYVFGGEESYGYLACDRVRDKDASAAVLMFCEMAASLKAQGKTVLDYLDEIHLKYGYHLESLLNIYYEGASGSEKIKNILTSYRQNPPKQIGDNAVIRFQDFGVQDFADVDGKPIAKENFYFLELDNGYRFAVRGSGTEPKIKFYLFAREPVAEPSALAQVRAQTAQTLKQLKEAIDADARKRAEG
jgi:phosphoglucomutase